MTDLILQPLDTNADFVVFVDWLVPDGATVAADASVCVVETSKATVEIAAPASGVLHHRAKVGDKVAVGAVLAVVLGKDEREAKPAVGQTSADDRISRKAAELIARHGLSIADLPDAGFVTVAEVEQVLAVRRQQVQRESGGIFLKLEGVDMGGVTFPEESGAVAEGRMDAAYLARLKADPQCTRGLSEAEHLALLRTHGAAIGEGVSIGRGTVVMAPQIVMRAGASIGEGGTVWCGERFQMGPLARFGPNVQVRCQEAVVGAGAYAEHDIVIGGGGHKDPWAVLVIGDECYIGSAVHLNTCRPLLIGRQSFVTNGATLLTHNVGHSYIDGHENRFAAVVLEDGCVVGFNTVLYAGARLGAGAVVGSNSYVLDAIPPGKLALGVPARVVAEAKQTLSPARREARARDMFADFHRLLVAKGYDVIEGALDTGTLRLRHGARELGLALRPGSTWDPLPAGTHWIVWTLELPASPHDDLVVVDLVSKQITGAGDDEWTGSVREYLRKRGLRLQPGPWRYAGGLV